MISLSRAMRADADAILVARPAPTPSMAFSATVERFGNAQIPTPMTFAPRLTRYTQSAGTVTGDSVVLPAAASAGRFVDGYFNGGAVRVYRIVNDEMVLVREDTVAAWHARSRFSLTGNAYIPQATTVWRWAPGQFHRPSALVRFAVSTIAADGRVSPISNVVTYTTPATSVAQSVSNATTTSLTVTTENGALAVPQNVAATPENGGNSVAITWDAVPGALGYIVWRTQYDFANLASAVDLVGGAGKEPVQTGDLMIFERRLNANTTRASCTTDALFFVNGDCPFPLVNWGWAEDIPSATLASLTDPVEGPYLRVTLVTDLGGSPVFSGGTAQTYYDVLDPAKTYAVTIRARGAVGGEQITVRRHGVTRTITLTNQWADHTVTWQPPSVFSGGNELTDITYKAPATFDILYIAAHRADTPPGGIDPDEAVRLAAFKPSFIRLHQFCKTNPWSYDLDEITGRQGNSTRSLPQQLGAIIEAGAQPWLQIEWVWTDAELLDLVEYLCAPYDPATDTPQSKPWAYRRHAQGRTAPWLAAFDTILFEAGNENWNSTNSFYLMPVVSGQSAAKANALMSDRMTDIMRSSPYWTAEAEAKFKWVLGGWRPRVGQTNAIEWTQTNAQWSLHADYLAIADYNGGWDSGQSLQTTATPGAWEKVVGDTVITNRRGATTNLVNYCANNARAGRTKPLVPATYEAGPGYTVVSPGNVNERPQDELMKTVGVGTATLDAFLLNAALGVLFQNFFTYGARFQWATHTRWIDGEATNPSGLWLGLVNRLFMPGTVAESVALATPRGTISTTANADLLGAYRLDGPGGKVGLALCNRTTDTTLDVAARVPAPGATSLTRWTMTGDYQAHNTTAATADAVALVPEPIPILDSITVTIPPGEAVVYEWSAA